MSVEADSVILVMRSGLIGKDEFLRAQDVLLKVNPAYGFVLNGAELIRQIFRYFTATRAGEESKHLSEGAKDFKSRSAQVFMGLATREPA